MLYRIFERVIELERRGVRVIKLNVGEPDLQPPQAAIEAAIEALKQGMHGYGHPAGEAELRERLAQLNGVAPANVVVVPGSKWALYSVFHALPPNSTIVIIAPCWPTYAGMASVLGHKIRVFSTSMSQGWLPDMDELVGALDGVKALVLTNPANPTGTIIKPRALEELVKAAEARDVRVICDEAYYGLAYESYKSLAELTDGHVLVRTFSKAYAMPGWRIGYVVAPEELAAQVIELNKATVTCVPKFVQRAALAAIEDVKHLKEVREIYERRIEMACQVLKTPSYTKPGGAFYLFPEFGDSGDQVAMRLLDRGVATVPGSAFGPYPSHLRISLTRPEDELREGLSLIEEEARLCQQ